MIITGAGLASRSGVDCVSFPCGRMRLKGKSRKGRSREEEYRGPTQHSPPVSSPCPPGKDDERMAIAIVLLLVAVGSVVFHMVSPWWWTPIASHWSYIDHTLIITFWITGVVFVAVVGFTAYCVWRFRHREGGEAALYEPENKK